MSDSKSLKEQNAWLIRAAMIAHIVAFAWIAAEPLKLLSMSARGVAEKLEALALPGSASLGIIVIASLLLLGMIPPDWRDRIIHLKWRHPLPGCRAFTKIGPNSSHVDMQALIAKFGPLPTDPSNQNKLFYKIYRSVRDDVGVCDAHRRYLAARDIGTITAILVLPLPVLVVFVTHNGSRSFAYAMLLFMTYIFCALAAKNYSWRMVQHVLALNSSDVQPSLDVKT